MIFAEDSLYHFSTLFVLGLAILTWGADFFVRGASQIGQLINVSPILIGATVVAFGSSAPELFVALQAAQNQQMDVVFGNIIGSNICNIGLGIGLCALIHPFSMKGNFRDKEFIFFFLSTLFFFLFLREDHLLSKNEAFMFLAAFTVFMFFCMRSALNQEHEIKFIEENLPPLLENSTPKTQKWLTSIFKIIAGFFGLHYGSDFLIEGAMGIGHYLNFSEAVVGLFLVAIGTSLPEIAISIIASIKREEGIALGNILGSNVFNILFVSGFTGAIYPLQGHDSQIMDRDLPMMILLSLIFLSFLRFGKKLTRLKGFLLIGTYFLYTLMRI